MKTRSLAVILSLLAVVLIICSCSSGVTTTPSPTTSLDGKTLVQERCSACHPLARIERTDRTADEWKSIVDKMIAKGARLTPEEEAVVVEYLATNFGK